MLQTVHADWMKNTDLGFVKVRSAALKKVDAAILAYNKAPSPANASSIATLLEQWERSRDSDTPSERDKRGAVTALKQDLERENATGSAFRDATFSQDELDAFEYMMQQRKQTLTATFQKAEVVFVGKKSDPSSAINQMRSLVSKGATAYKVHNSMTGSSSSSNSSSNSSDSGGSSQAIATMSSALSSVVAAIKEQLLQMADEFFGRAVSSLAGLGAHILSWISDVAGMVAPYVSHLLDAKKMIMGWADVGKKAYAQYDVGKRAYAMEVGTASAAFKGVMRCMEQETIQASLVAGNATLAFAAKTGAAFGDFGAASGTAIGIVSALAEFARRLYLLSVEWRATRKLKKLLDNPTKLDLTVFQTYPLAGAYLVTSATLSDLIPINNFGTPEWQKAIEKGKKGDFDKIYQKAEDLIHKSPWEITGLPKRKIIKPTLSTKLKFAKSTGGDLAKEVIKETLLG